MSAMHCIGISIRPKAEHAKDLAESLAYWLTQKGCEVLCDSTQETQLHETVSLSAMSQRIDLLVVLGGDGTLLHAARHFMNCATPILGINLGRLGFLTDTPVGSMFDVMTAVLDGHFKSKQHFGLKASCWRGSQCLTEDVAMNDVVLQRYAHPRPIEFEVLFREQEMFRLHADGLILATPAGSTAYALSAGGPIVHPEVEAISVVPLCPHTLSNRPVVIPTDGIITLRLTQSPQPSMLSLDGQECQILEEGDEVRIQKAGTVHLIYLPERHYFSTLRSKLHWAGHNEA